MNCLGQKRVSKRESVLHPFYTTLIASVKIILTFFFNFVFTREMEWEVDLKPVTFAIATQPVLPRKQLVS